MRAAREGAGGGRLDRGSRAARFLPSCGWRAGRRPPLSEEVDARLPKRRARCDEGARREKPRRY